MIQNAKITKIFYMDGNAVEFPLLFAGERKKTAHPKTRRFCSPKGKSVFFLLTSKRSYFPSLSFLYPS